MSICVVVPTRGRPDAAAELAREFYRTRALEDTYIMFAIDDDDVWLGRYRELLLGQPNVFITVGPRLRMGPTLNKVAVEIAPAYDIIGFMGDDHRPRTPDWDSIVAGALEDAPGVLYGNDGIQGVNLPTAVFITSTIVQKLGYMAPPGLVHLYLDNFWLDLGQATNLTYRGDLYIEHMHPIAGKADWDPGYLEANSNQVTEHDAAEYQRYLRYDWPTARERVTQ